MFDEFKNKILEIAKLMFYHNLTQDEALKLFSFQKLSFQAVITMFPKVEKELDSDYDAFPFIKNDEDMTEFLEKIDKANIKNLFYKTVLSYREFLLANPHTCDIMGYEMVLEDAIGFGFAFKFELKEFKLKVINGGENE